MKEKTFRGGVHPPQLKQLTEDKPLEVMPAPERAIIPLLQHFGRPAKPLVAKGSDVLVGQKIGEADSLFSACVHSSVSGKVLSVDAHPHPGGNQVLAVTVANDGQDRASPLTAAGKDPFSLSPDEIRQKVKEAGVVGLGGAAFPTAVKLFPPKDKPVDTVIINGCECEPMLTSDYRLMLEAPEAILNGAQIVRIATGAKRMIIGIEDNKKKAFEVLKEKMNGNNCTQVSLLKTKYPQGAEKNLIYALLRREVPRGGLPFDVGVVVQNVGTAKAAWEAVSAGKPLYEKAITVSGDGIRVPKNISVRVGTPFKDVVDFCGGLKEEADIFVMGGPMMGLSQWSLEVPVVKGTSGILAWQTSAVPKEYPCIRCGRCVEKCPMFLVPTQLAKFVKFDKLTEAENWGVTDCVECGCCQYVCPSKIPLVHWIRLGKNKVLSLKRKKSA
jgi:electron transport complex protein RnfC